MSRFSGAGLGLQLAFRSTRTALAESGAARVLIVALIVAVASVVAVTRLTDRVSDAVLAEAGQTLGADLKLDLNAPPDAAIKHLLSGPSITSAEIVELTTALARGDNLLRARLQAVPRRYPLSGQIVIAGGNGKPRSIDHGPAPGRLFVDESVLARLHVHIGERLDVGNTHLTIAARLVSEPGSGNLFDTASTVLMNRSDLAATGLTGPAAREDYSLLVNAPANQRAALRKALKKQLAPGESIVEPADANRGLSDAMAKAGVFLNLAALCAVILAGIAITLSALRHAVVQRDAIALYKTLGADRGVIRGLLVGQLVFLGMLGLLIGWIVGEISELLLSQLADLLFHVVLPLGEWWVAWPAAGVVVVLLAGFAWPAMRRALATPPARILAGAIVADRTRQWPAYGLSIVALALLAIGATQNLSLSLWVMGGLGVTGLVFSLVVTGLLFGLAWLRRRFDDRLSPAVRLGLDSVLRRRATTTTQAVALGLGLTVVFVLVIVRGDLLASWQTQVADNAPNQFVININDNQRASITDFLTQRGLAAPRFYPIVRARLSAIDGSALSGHPKTIQRAGRLADRALNLSWAERLKADNTVTAGHWWAKAEPAIQDGPHPISIADSVARQLQVRVGDTLSFDVAGQPLTARIASIRHIDWSSLQPNFFILFPPGVLSGYPTSWITSFYLPSGREAVLAHLVEAFPNLTTIDIGALLARIEQLVDRVSLAVELVFGFTLAAGLVVLTAALRIHRDERRREAAVLRALGATSKRLRRAAWVECVIIGLVSALPAVAAAQVAAHLIAHYSLHVGYQARPSIWIAAAVLAVLGIAGAGVLTLGDVRRQPAWQALRDSE